MAKLNPPRPLGEDDPIEAFDCGRDSLNAWLHRHARRNRPENVAVVLLGQLAVDRRFQGRGFARQLLLYALRTCAALSKEIGCFAVLTHPLDDEVRAFYRYFGFEDLPGDPRRSMAVRIKDLVHNGLN